MPSDDKRILNQKNKQEELENKFQNTHDQIIETIKDRKKTEKDYLDIIKKQKIYWEDQLKNTDPEKDKDRYNKIKKDIEREDDLIKQINEELNRIDKELKMEKKHKNREEEHKKEKFQHL